MVIATTSSVEYIESIETEPVKTSSVDASYSDPDLLIREYFLSSSAQRAKSRATVAQHVREIKAIFAILSWGASGKARDGFDGAVNLLAEIRNSEILSSACQAAKTLYPQMYANSRTKVFAERFLEILVKAIACAYHIHANHRFSLLSQLLTVVNNRITEASLIDALLIISDEVDINLVKEAIENFTHNSDQYICDYAREALQDIG
jgi:hypothetical protein